MNSVKLNISNALSFFTQDEYNLEAEKIVSAQKELMGRQGLGNDYIGWLDLPVNYDKEEFARIKECALRIQKQAEVLIVVGIGGSYLGAKAALEFHRQYFNNNGLEIIFVGHQISGEYVNELVEYVKDKEFAINVISKSGTTTEPAIAFRIFKNLIEQKYGKEEAKNRIYATTDGKKGALKTVATELGYETFIVPDDVGGRFSVLTPVGLLPIACAGIDIEQMMLGASDARSHYQTASLENNDSLKYALVRNLLHTKGKDIEVLVNYEPKLNLFAEWWKQLFGESEGKDHKGIFVASCGFSTDLHSMGQMIQDGKRNLFETVLSINKPNKESVIPFDEADLDGLNFLSGKTMDFVNKQASLGTVLAHVDGGVPNMLLEIEETTPYVFGQLVYFFEYACGVSGYRLGVNPFNQPGVEAYKKNMFALLGKAGYEDLKAELEAKLK